MATKWVKLPSSWSNKREVEQLDPRAYAALSRAMLRAVAETGSTFSVWSAGRTHADQVAIFKKNYTRVSRGRKLSTDRGYAGSIWARKSGGVSVASPDLGSNHEDGMAVDIHPAAVQNWLKVNGLRFGISWDEGKRVGEDWHFRVIPSKDQYTAEGIPDVKGIQKALGVTVDDKFGPGTSAAVKAWQLANGLAADGIPGARTVAAMLGKAVADVVDNVIDAVPEIVTPDSSATPGWMPGVSTVQTFTGNPHKAAVTKLVLHTTEGSSWPGYGGGGSAPHFTVKPGAPSADTIRQHIPTTEAAKALVNRTGGVETNNGGAVQVEFVGSCDRAYATKHGLLFTEDATDDDLAALAYVFAWITEAHSIPLAVGADLSWPTTNAAYATAPQRLTGPAWDAYSGILGHTHVPENDHWDPGAFPIGLLLELAGGAHVPDVPTPAPSNPDLPTGKALLVALIDAPDFPLLRTPGNRCYYGPKTGPKESVSGHVPNSLNPGEVDDGAQGLKDWQAQMNERGYDLTVDGKYGDKTATAADNLQRLAGVARDSLIGPDTFYAAWLLPVVS